MRFNKPSFRTLVIYLGIGALVIGVFKHSLDVATAQEAAGTPATAASSDHHAVYNSPEMLRARAWLNEYCQSGDVVSQEEAAAHMQALETMTPAQMKLFATMHDSVSKSHPKVHAHATHQQALEAAQRAAQAQKWWYENVHKAEARRSMQANQAANQSLNSISAEETSAANQEQKQLNAEQSFARENQQSKMDQLNSPYTTGGYYANPYYYGGGSQFHFHLYPGP